MAHICCDRLGSWERDWQRDRLYLVVRHPVFRNLISGYLRFEWVTLSASSSRIHCIWLAEVRREAIIDLCIVNEWYWFYQHQCYQEEELRYFLDRVREVEEAATEVDSPCDPWDHMAGSRALWDPMGLSDPLFWED